MIDRSEGYIGVLIDDIINKKTPEPYRVLPSRAEYRLTLRQDNVFIRLLEKSKEIGILDKNTTKKLEDAVKEIDEEVKRLKEITIYPTKENNEKLKNIEGGTENSMNSPVSAYDFLARKEINYDNLSEFCETLNLSKLAKEQVEINAKYKIFIEREKAQIEKFKKLEEMEIPKNFDYENVKGLSNIAISGLIYGNPKNIGQASRISGVTYNDISILIAMLKSLQ